MDLIFVNQVWRDRGCVYGGFVTIYVRRLGLFFDGFFFAIAVILLREAVLALSTFLLRATGVGISQKVMSERGTASSRGPPPHVKRILTAD